MIYLLEGVRARCALSKNVWEANAKKHTDILQNFNGKYM